MCVAVFIAVMTRNQPISSLFPYTTLFRSEDVAAERDRVVVVLGLDVVEVGVADERLADKRRQEDGAEEQREPVVDRKSTRLNSSHTVISYAVFCLKKKNQDYRIFTTDFKE